MINSKYLFVGGVFPKEKEKEILRNSKGSVQNAANVLQWNLIEGFNFHLGEDFSILNAPYIGSFPKRYKKLFIKSHKFFHGDGVEDYNVGFCNLSGLKRFSIRNSLRRQIKKWIKNGKRKAIIAYAMTDSSIRSLVCAKKLDPDIKTCLIVPDLPQYMSQTRDKKSRLIRALKKTDWKLIKSNMKYIDSYVLLTEQMSKFLEVDNYVVVEGVATDSFKNIIETPSKEKRVLYAGTLSYRYGIGDLLKAFELIKDKNYRLDICGAGEADAEIRKLQEKDSRINFLGRLPREEVLKLQKRATVLVNPRKNKGEYTKYSFPSKIMEYLSSGTPVVAYKLDGIQEEYDKYIKYVSGDDCCDLATAIVEVCERPEEERREIGEMSRKFVLEQKNAVCQTEKILNLIAK